MREQDDGERKDCVRKYGVKGRKEIEEGKGGNERKELEGKKTM